MLVLNFMYMKKNLFRFSSRRFLFSTVMAFALVTGAPQGYLPMWEKCRLFRRLG